MFLFGQDLVQSLKKIIKILNWTEGSNVFENFGTYQMGLPPSDLLLMTLNIECLIFITILAERKVH